MNKDITNQVESKFDFALKVSCLEYIILMWNQKALIVMNWRRGLPVYDNIHDC